MTSLPRRVPRHGWRGGLELGTILGVGTAALAVSFGAFAVSHGWPAWLIIALSALTFSAAAQFALVTAFAGGGGGLAALTAAILVNARFIPMAAATARSLKGGPVRRALEGQAVVDGSFVGSVRADGTVDREKMLAATLVQWIAWVGGTAIGAVIAPSAAFLYDFGLDVVFPSFFLILLLDTLRVRPDLIVVSAVAVGIAVVALLVVPGGLALILCAVAALLGAFRSTRPRAEPGLLS